MSRLPTVLPAVALLLAATLLSACDAPDPAPDEGVPDPQAQTAPPAEEATELRDAINEPLDKAKAVEDAEKARDEARRAELEDAGG